MWYFSTAQIADGYSTVDRSPVRPTTWCVPSTRAARSTSPGGAISAFTRVFEIREIPPECSSRYGWCQAPRAGVTSCRRLRAAADRPGLEGRTGLSQVARSSLAHRRKAPARPSCSKHRRRPRQAAIYTPVAFGRRAPSFDSASISSGRQRGGIEQHVSTCDNIEKVIPLSSIHIIR